MRCLIEVVLRFWPWNYDFMNWSGVTAESLQTGMEQLEYKIPVQCSDWVTTQNSTQKSYVDGNL